MYLLKLIDDSWLYQTLPGYDLFVFAIGSLVTIFLLLWYYQRISKKTTFRNRSEEAKPVYVYKDVLLQQKSTDENPFPTTTKLPLALKIIAISLILLIIITPLYKLLNVEHFV